MKKLLFTITITLISTIILAQWEATDVMEHNQVNQGSPVFASCIHKGAVYVSTKIPQRSEIIKSIDNGETWTDINFPEHIGWFSHIVSVDNRLYVANYNNWYAKSTIWYTEDDGETWVIDTAGMPGGGGANGGAYVISMHGWRGHLIATFGGADLYYMKSFDGNWELVEDLVPVDPSVYDSRGDTVFAVKKYSPDFGQTWITPSNNGLPSNIAPQAIFATGNRIYISGDNLGSNILVYSDDSGENWQTIDLGEWAGQAVWSIYAMDQQLWLGINSDVTTRVLYSSDGGNTFDDYSDGLPEDPFGTYQISNFMRIENTLFAANNFMDVYKRNIEINSGLFDHETNQMVRVYPNPARDFIAMDAPADLKITSVEVFDLNGVLQISTTGLNKQYVEISELRKGSYLIRFTRKDGKNMIAKFMKK
ncbi:MAG: T9SS type A sorting domain-containing protein [Bacteroidales bacterium]|nr:T9SS type A sorting domain-containing protein [Bacteroidales bacterium]MCF8386896.1 T9SS type A sorting domain-containing protein [Bacteroidales bacterium]MCF8399381.1 T9SS type A sorting domain-containing protein [Bacteroidales bacterium]